MNNFMRNVLVWAILGSFIMFILNSVENTNTRETISYSEFKQDVLSDRVAKVIYKGDQMTIIGDRLDGSKFETTQSLYKTDEAVNKAIQENNVVTIYEKPEQPSIWSQLLVGAFPILLLLAIFFFFMRQMQGGMSGKGGPMSFGRSKAKLMEGGKVKTNFQDVAGCEEAKQDVQELVDFLRDPSKFQKLGGKIPRGVLMVGLLELVKHYLLELLQVKQRFLSLRYQDLILLKCSLVLEHQGLEICLSKVRKILHV